MQTGFQWRLSVVLAASLLAFGTVSQYSLSYSQANVNSGAGFVSPNPSQQALPEEEQKYNIKTKVTPEGETVEETKLDAPEPKDASLPQSPKFLVSDVEVVGVTVYPPEIIESLVGEYEGKEQTLEELGELVNAINKLYRSKGYLSSQALIPPQDIEDGKVQIQVIEGRIGALTIAGNKFFRTSTIERHIPYGPGSVFNIRDLEDTLNGVNQHETFRLKAVLKPGRANGETDIRFEVAERQPWQVSGTFDNQGRPFIGFYRYGVEVNNNNFSGIGDRLFFRWIGARGDWTNVYSGGYTLPVNSWGTELGYNFSYTKVNLTIPDITPDPNIGGSAASHSVFVSHPLNRSRSLSIDAGFNARNISQFIDSTTPGSLKTRSNRDSIYSLQTGLSFNKPDRWGRTFLRGQFTWAPEWDSGYVKKFTKYELFFSRLLRLPYNNLLIMKANAQMTPDNLPSAEQFQIGGAYSVRGFTEGLLAGDRGVYFGVEDQFPIPGLRQVSPYLADRFKGAVFVDYGQAWFDRQSRPGRVLPAAQFNNTGLVSMGVGFRGSVTQYLQGFVDLAWGLVDRTAQEPTRSSNTMRVHFGLRTDLLPQPLKTRDTEERPIKGSPVREAADGEKEAYAPAALQETETLSPMQQAALEAMAAQAIDDEPTVFDQIMADQGLADEPYTAETPVMLNMSEEPEAVTAE